jgi:hypoxanthine-guanine phosphoribosyltransferase
MKLIDILKKYDIIFLSTIIFIYFYHYYIQTNLEKIFFKMYFGFETVKRPYFDYEHKIYSLKDYGMPSGHAEIGTIISCILYNYKYIPLWMCILVIIIISLQRIISIMHSTAQVTVGIICGLIYSYIYISNNLSLGSLGIVLFIGLILAVLTVYKIDKQIHEPIPDWVDKSMIPYIEKKQNVPYIYKIAPIYSNSLFRKRVFITWSELESYLDILIEKIKQTNIHFDCVVGIKTGGAIISDYISKKLNIPNYKVKISKNDDVYEGIDDNLEGKNIILIDELVSSDYTMKKTMDYLIFDKKVNIVYPCSVAVSKYDGLNKTDIKIEHVLPSGVLVWPWGYNN